MTRSLFLGAAVLLPLCIDAVRKAKGAKAGPGTVSHLYTFGAPHTASSALRSRDGGCFSGYRVVNHHKNGWLADSVDVVPTLLQGMNYNHAHMAKLGLRDNTPDPYKDLVRCGRFKIRVQTPSKAQHDKERYVSNVGRLDSSVLSYRRLQAAAKVGLEVSYERDLNKVKSNAQKYGWRLVGSAVAGEDVSHLLQQQTSKRCILTFEGTDGTSDILTDLNIVKVLFCGFGFSRRVHLGFRNELRRMVQSGSYQNGIRSKLGKCANVDVVGHSLGGAVAELFSSCVNNQNYSDDYKRISWNRVTPTLMASL